jgi:hypothetical protein
MLFGKAEIEAGELHDSIVKATFVITVGDRVTETAAELGRVPDVQIVDGVEKRKKRVAPDIPRAVEIEVKNPPATITAEAVRGIRAAFRGKKPARVLVEGEEDLLAIPAVVLAPMAANLYYGQPHEGVVLVKVDAKAKSRSRRILAEMKKVRKTVKRKSLQPPTHGGERKNAGPS